MTDFTVLTRLDGDASGLKTAAQEGGDAVDKFGDRAAAAQAKANSATQAGTTADQARAVAADTVTKSVTASAAANENAADAVASHTKEVLNLSKGVTQVVSDLAAGKTATDAFAASVASAASSVAAVAANSGSPSRRTSQYSVVNDVANLAASAMGKSTAAAQEGAAADEALAAATDATIKSTAASAAANENAADAVANHSRGIEALSKDVANAAVNLAAGSTASQGFMSGLADIASAASSLLAPLALVAAAVVALFVGGVAHANELSARTRGLTVELQALGRSSDISAGQVTAAIDAVAFQPGANRASAGAAAQEFFAQGIFNPDLVNRGLQQSRNLSLALGGDLTSAAKTVAAAMSGSGDALDKLDSKMHLLTDDQRTQIRTLQEQGQANEAASIVIDALGKRLDVLATSATTSGQQISSSIGGAWTRALDAFSQTAPVQAAASAIRGVGDAIANSLTPSAASAQQQLDRVNASIANVAAQRSASVQSGGFGLSGYDAQLRDLQSQRDQLAKQVALTQATDPFGPGQGSINGESGTFAQQADDASKRVRTLIETLDGLPRQNEAVHNALARITQDFADGKLAADQFGTAAGLLQGQLDKLRSPVQQSADDLSNAQDRAATPRAQRAYLQYMQGVAEQSRGIPEVGPGGTTPRADFIANKAQEFTVNFDQQSRDMIEDLRQSAEITLDAVKAYAQGPAASLRAAAVASANAQVQSGTLAPEAAGAYAQETLNNQAASQLLGFASTTQAYKEQTDALQRLVDAEAQGGAAAREADRANQVATATSKLRAAAEASGSQTIVDAAQKEIAAYDAISKQAADAQRQREAQQLNQQFDPAAAYQQSIAKLQDLQATGILTERTVADATKQYEQARLDASRSATDGMIAGLRRYADEATNAGKQASDGIASAMSSAEDAVAQFATTGTINVGNLANSIIGDMARIAARQAILGPLSSGFASLFGSIFGSSPSINSLNQQAINNIASGAGGVGAVAFHSGGLVGDIPRMTRNVPLSVFANARRYHTGGVVLGPNEVPIIAQQGEEVLTKDQRAARNAGGGSPIINIYDQAGVKVSAQSGRSTGGLPSIDLLIQPLEKAMARNISNGRGPMVRAMQDTFGVQQIGRG